MAQLWSWGALLAALSLTCSCWACHADVCVDKSLATSGDDSRLGGIDVVAGCESTAARRQASLCRELLDQERGRHCVGNDAGDLDAFGGRRVCSVAGVVDGRLGGHVLLEVMV